MKKTTIYISIMMAAIMLILTGCSGKTAGSEAAPAPESVQEAAAPEAPIEEAPEVFTEIADISPQPLYHNEDIDADYGFKTEGKYLAVYDGEGFNPTYLNGVNLGSGTPGYFPGELAIDKATYLRWFYEIADMGCNCVRIYTTMMPCFYEAFYEYNHKSDRKLYLIMGVWYDEDTIAKTGDAYDIFDGAMEEAKEQVDIIHGDCTIRRRAGRAYGTYRADVSDYVMGWILGIESDAYFVGTTIDLHPDITSYDGKYLEVKDSDAFHAFLCRLGDETIAYETEKYGMQRPVSWANWPTADELSHPEEPLFEREDAVSINIEKIKAKESFAPGLFASYHVYPYYPDFMMLEEKYITHRDRYGNINTYEAYLQDLFSIHEYPVLVAEFGVPTSRGCTHANPFNHFDQGHLNEQEQGEALSHMAEDIFVNGGCGGIVFTWQDEWFKRTWNTMDYTDPDRRPFWSDIQTSEQNFGLLSFDPGEERMKVLIDGDFEDWEKEYPLTKLDKKELMVKHDERYLYLCVWGPDFRPGTDRLTIAMDVTPESGSDIYNGLSFDRKADFVIELRGREDSTVLVHKYYDRYAFAFGPFDDLLDESGYNDENSNSFVPIYLSLNRTQQIPTTGEIKHAEHMDSGLLRYGNANPESPSFDSLADFCYGDDFVELRIPWGLISFRDPSTLEAEADFWKKGELTGLSVPGIYINFADDKEIGVSELYSWSSWDKPVFHERLKASYDILGDCFKTVTVLHDTP